MKIRDGDQEVISRENIYLTDEDLIEKTSEYCGLTLEDRYRKRMLLRSIAQERFDIEAIIPVFRELLEGP